VIPVNSWHWASHQVPAEIVAATLKMDELRFWKKRMADGAIFDKVEVTNLDDATTRSLL
jgi:hypothetical protein